MCTLWHAHAFSDGQIASRSYRDAVHLLEIWLQSVVDFDRLPGLSLAVIHDQETVYAQGFGYLDTERHIKTTPRTIYRLSSISKVFTSIAVMQLRDAGRLNLDDPVRKYLPWFVPEPQPSAMSSPTLLDLLRHSGGLPCEPDLTVWENADLLYPSREDLIRRVSCLKMSYPLNTTFNYSNLGYALLGEIVSVVSGLEYADYVQQKILDPLALKSTTVNVPQMLLGSELAVGYGRWPREGARTVITNRPSRAFTPAMGFSSTVEDMAEFAKWQFRVLAGRDTSILCPKTLAEIHTVHWQDAGWGLGFATWQMNGKVFVGHQGGCPGYKSQIVLCPEDKIAVVAMINATDAPQFTLVFRTHEIMAPVLDRLSEEDVPVQEEWRKYAGYYTAEESWSEAEVLEWDGALAVLWLPTENPLGSLVKLRRTEGEIFRQVNSDGKLGKHYVFKADSEGNIVGMKFNNNVIWKTAH